MRIITLNANGIRAASRKGLFQWFEEQNADVLCIQETKAHMHELEESILKQKGYQLFYHNAEKKGYSGVAIYTRAQPKSVSVGLGFPYADTEGRYIQVDFDEISIASLYLPSGASKEERQLVKFEFMAFYENRLREIAEGKQPFIICGDLNIVHKEIDIRNWKSNQKNSGCLPEERAWLDKLFDKFGLVDSFRVVNQMPDQYTWWSNRGQSWAKNVGWRLDYQVITKHLKPHVKSVEIYKEKRFSDHAPLIIDYDFKLNSHNTNTESRIEY